MSKVLKSHKVYTVRYRCVSCTTAFTAPLTNTMMESLYSKDKLPCGHISGELIFAGALAVSNTVELLKYSHPVSKKAKRRLEKLSKRRHKRLVALTASWQTISFK